LRACDYGLECCQLTPLLCHPQREKGLLRPDDEYDDFDFDFDESEEAWADRAFAERAQAAASTDPEIAYELHEDSLLQAVLSRDLPRVKHLIEWSEVPITRRALDAGVCSLTLRANLFFYPLALPATLPVLA
jgi:hypothetical protein